MACVRFLVVVTLLLCVAWCGEAALFRAQVTDPGFKCPEDGQFAHPDCNRWYNCGADVAWVMTCPEDWLYDSTLNWCNWPDQVQCGERKMPS